MTITVPANPFKNATMHDSFENAITHFMDKGPLLFEGRTPSRNNSFAGFFWRGYAFPDKKNLAPARDTLGYPFWRAGTEFRKLDEKNRGGPQYDPFNGRKL